MTAEMPPPQARDPAGGVMYPMSHGQMALWYMQRLLPKSVVYNVSFAWRVLSDVDIPALRRVLQWLVDRHAVLRTTFAPGSPEPVQVVHPHQKIAFTVIDAADWDEAEFVAALDREAWRPFDLERGPVMRACLILRAPGSHTLLLSFHHIAVDLWSLTLLTEEIGLLYPAARRGGAPPEARAALEFTDVVGWRRARVAGPDGERLWRYWRSQLDGDIGPLVLPLDFPHTPQQSDSGTLLAFRIDRDLTARAKEAAARERVTLNVLLLAAFETVLQRRSGQTAFLLRTLASGRSRAAFEPVIGFFANPVMIRADFTGDPTLGEVVQSSAPPVLWRARSSTRTIHSNC